jgi:hypothetical protein
MGYKSGIEAMAKARGKAFKSHSGNWSMGAEVSPESFEKVGKDFKTAGYCILAGLGILAIAEIVGHRNMTFKKGYPLGSSKVMSYK